MNKYIVIRWDKPDIWDPIVNAMNSHEFLMYQLRFKGTKFELGNRTVCINL